MDMNWFFAAGSSSVVNSTGDLFKAAAGGDIQALQEALSSGAEDTMTNGWKAIHTASAKGHLGCVRVLCESLYDDEGQLCQELAGCGRTALHLAAKNGREDVVAYLISRGGERLVNAMNLEGHTALAEAAHCGHLRVTERLVDAGSDPGHTNVTEGMTPLLVAAAAGRVETFLFLAGLQDRGLVSAKSMSGQTALHKAAAPGHVRLVDHILQLNAQALAARPSAPLVEVDATAEDGTTALHHAAQVRPFFFVVNACSFDYFSITSKLRSKRSSLCDRVVTWRLSTRCWTPGRTQKHSPMPAKTVSIRQPMRATKQCLRFCCAGERTWARETSRGTRC
mmetsp:Transcript_477/g.1030  ORF Transcript_477/g.1030 Transcript_477/m.1030 type:complete len:337 (+) Transcript_477:61-1071(+)